MRLCATVVSAAEPFSPVEQASFFFQPVELKFELADLLIELSLVLFLVLLVLAPSVREHLGQLLQKPLFPLDEKVRMDAVLAGNFVDGPLTLDDLQSQAGFILGSVALAL